MSSSRCARRSTGCRGRRTPRSSSRRRRRGRTGRHSRRRCSPPAWRARPGAAAGRSARRSRARRARCARRRTRARRGGRTTARRPARERHRRARTGRRSRPRQHHDVVADPDRVEARVLGPARELADGGAHRGGAEARKVDAKLHPPIFVQSAGGRKREAARPSPRGVDTQSNRNHLIVRARRSE